MPTPRKLSIMFAFPSYGGNGGIASEHPDIRKWYVETVLECQKDERIGEVHEITLSDTPVTMVRNRFVQAARMKKCDVLVMVDSDQAPNFHAKEQGFEPFFKSTFDFLYKHYDKGPCVVGAPYCGPPPFENVYVFRWASDADHGDETSFSLEQYSRNEASQMFGIQECAALPTGLIMYDMRCFELIEPAKMTQREVLESVQTGKLGINEAMRNLSQGWFYYEWKDRFACEKASTEDVTNTRDIALAGHIALGYNPVYCNWNSPIGHWKPWCVGRPKFFGNQSVSEKFRNAVLRNSDEGDRIVDFPLPDRFKNLPVNYVAPEKNGKVVVMNGRQAFVADGHKTPDEHLDALAKFICSESERRQGKILDVAEVGSWHGDSANAMANTGEAIVTCIDHWQGTAGDVTGNEAKRGNPMGEFLERTKSNRHLGYIKFKPGHSVEVAAQCDDESFDVIHIDADHSYEAMKADIAAWWPKLHPHGVMIGHDYKVHQFPGVTQAAEECFEKSAIERLGFEKIGWGYWVVRKAATAYAPPEKEMASA